MGSLCNTIRDYLFAQCDALPIVGVLFSYQIPSDLEAEQISLVFSCGSWDLVFLSSKINLLWELGLLEMLGKAALLTARVSS